VKHLLRAVVPHHVLWGAQSGAVFDALRGDFMGDVVSAVDELLAEGTCGKSLLKACCNGRDSRKSKTYQILGYKFERLK